MKWIAIGSGATYAFYLLHQFIGFAIIKSLRELGWNSEWIILIPFVLIACVAVVVHIAFEKPIVSFILNFKKKTNE